MAQEVNIVLVSDLTGEEIPQGAGETISYALDGVTYEIDLTDSEAETFRGLFADHLSVSRRVGGRRQRGTASASSATHNRPSAADIRAWAKDNGHDVPGRGRIPAEVRDAYKNAH